MRTVCHRLSEFTHRPQGTSVSSSSWTTTVAARLLWSSTAGTELSVQADCSRLEQSRCADEFATVTACRGGPAQCLHSICYWRKHVCIMAPAGTHMEKLCIAPTREDCRVLTTATRRLNKCGVISPRYDVRHGDIETWIGKLMPSRLVRAAPQLTA